MNYHVVPNLIPEEIKAIKMFAIHLDISVKELVRRAILLYLVRLQIEQEEEK